MAEPNWYVFLSHGSPDKPFVRRLKASIEACGYRTWIDENEMFAGDALPARVSAALMNAGAYIAVISRDSVESKWFDYELQIATGQMIGGKLLVIAARIDETAIPAELESRIWADFRGDFEDGLRTVLAALGRAVERRNENSEPPGEDLVADSGLFNASSDRASQLEELLGERVADVVGATRLFELQTESIIDVPSAQLLDFLSHVSVLVARTELTPAEQGAQLSSAEEHLIRALLEGPEKHVGQLVAQLEKRRNELVRSDSPSGAGGDGARPDQDIEAKWKRIKEGVAEARSGRLACDWDGAFAAISRLHEVAVLCDELAVQLDRHG
ncbi:MAG TPA: toll/interleukin-1 receptor domain-containing protein [Solirubrobacterales bacterium]|nr:toll/interleukin-1 receptor domain-containing protein [Solirubrobacterales bacterium]